MPYHFIAAVDKRTAEGFANQKFRKPGGYGVKLTRAEVADRRQYASNGNLMPIWQVLTIPCEERDLSFAKLSTEDDPTPWDGVRDRCAPVSV